MGTKVRKAIIKGQMVTSESDKIDERIKRKASLSNIQQENIIYPHFKIEFNTYDPFPSSECVEELQSSIEECVISEEQLMYIADNYSSRDVLRADPVNEEETEFLNLGGAYIEESGNSSIVNVNLRKFEQIL
jgi:hypothetical protein